MKNVWSRIIIHVDLDAFFAAVEKLLNPAWKNLPVIVGADPQSGKGRGVVSAASYEAREYGVHSAMPISKAYRLCPNGIYVQPHGDVYREFSHKFIEILKKFSPLVEVISVDEAFLDMTGTMRHYRDVRLMGETLKNEIYSNIKLRASVGIASCKSVAKIASDFDKPDGLTIVEPGKVQQFLDPLPVNKLWGIGQKTSEQLLNLGIKKVYQLRKYPQEVLQKKFGQMGDHIYQMATGEDSRAVVNESEAKSVSNEVTFERDIDNAELIQKTIFKLAEKVGGRLRRMNATGATVQLKIRFSDFKTYTRSYTIKKGINATEQIFEISNLLFSEFLPLRFNVRLVGVGLSHLENEKGVQLSIWDHMNDKKLKLEKVMDQIQDKYGKNAIKHAESLTEQKPKKKDSI
jgi:nucleotidyltransferase/DNA polymerase involved in DNA repair